MRCYVLQHQELLETTGFLASTHLDLVIHLTTPHMVTHLTTPLMVIHHTTPLMVLLLLMEFLPINLTLDVDLAHGDVDLAAEGAVVVVAKPEAVATAEERNVIAIQRPTLERFLLDRPFFMPLERRLRHFLGLWV